MTVLIHKAQVKLHAHTCSPEETQAALSEGYPIPDNTPLATLLTHTSSQHHIPAKINFGREWAWGSTNVAIEVVEAKIYFILKVTLC